jgi:hypothetical protein
MISAKEARLLSEDAKVDITSILEKLDRRIATSAAHGHDSLECSEEGTEVATYDAHPPERQSCPATVKRLITELERLGYKWRWASVQGPYRVEPFTPGTIYRLVINW